MEERDEKLLHDIAYDGFLARRHIRQLHWPHAKTHDAMKRRLRKLKASGHVNWPTKQEYRENGITEPIVYLDWKGALWVARDMGLDVPEPISESETEKRKLKKRLLERGFQFVRTPRLTQMPHEISVVDIRLAILQEAAIHSGLTIDPLDTVPARQFRAQTDVVDFAYRTKNRGTKKGQKGVEPDWYCPVISEVFKNRGQPFVVRLLVEYDNATHPNTRFAKTKISAAAAYIASPAYKARFGANSGAWLIIAKSANRMKFLMRTCKQASIRDEHKLFFFSHLDLVKQGRPLTSPIWLQVDWKQPAPLPIT